MHRFAFGTALILIAVVLLVGGAFTAWTYFWYGEAGGGPKSAVSSTAPALTTNDIQISGWIDDRRVSPSDRIRFWIVVQNPVKDKPIQQVEIVAFRRPNFNFPDSDRDCWKSLAGTQSASELVPRCVDTTNLKSSPLPIASVAPGGSLTIEGVLVAGEHRGKFGLTAVVGWVDASNAHRRKPISIAPVVVESNWLNQTVYIARILQGIVKDFAFPLALLWLGVRIKKIETDREESRKRTDDRLARVQQTWILMLPKLHANTEKYYVPLMSYAQSVSKYHVSEREYAFFFYARYLAAMRQIVNEISGFYLKDVEGEEVVSLLWESLMDEADSAAWFGRELREQIQLAVPPILTFVEFKALHDRHVIRRARERFMSQDLTVTVALLELFSNALYFETNVCYVGWYDGPLDFPEKSMDLSLQRLKATLPIPLPSKYAQLIELLTGYVKHGPERARFLREINAA